MFVENYLVYGNEWNEVERIAYIHGKQTKKLNAIQKYIYICMPINGDFF